MFRKLLAVFGVLAVLAPEEVIDVGERLALRNPGECELKPWNVHVARVEGIAYLYLAWGSDAWYSRFKKLLAGVGLLALAYPRQFVDGAAAVAYEDADQCEWVPWAYPLARAVGALYVLLGLHEFGRD